MRSGLTVPVTATYSWNGPSATVASVRRSVWTRSVWPSGRPTSAYVAAATSASTTTAASARLGVTRRFLSLWSMPSPDPTGRDSTEAAGVSATPLRVAGVVGGAFIRAARADARRLSSSVPLGKSTIPARLSASECARAHTDCARRHGRGAHRAREAHGAWRARRLHVGSASLASDYDAPSHRDRRAGRRRQRRRADGHPAAALGPRRDGPHRDEPGRAADAACARRATTACCST